MALALGPIVGAVSEREARIWLRTQAAAGTTGTPRVAVRDARGRPVPGSPFEAAELPDGADSFLARVPLPAAYARYSYDVLGPDGDSLLPRELGQPGFWSAPPEDTRGSFRFGMLSCHKPAAYRERPRREAMWRRLGRVAAAEDLSFLLALGDQVYADRAWEKTRRARGGRPFPPGVVREYRKIYQSQWRQPAMARLLANHPTYMIWDDHEITNGWGSHRLDRGSRLRREHFAAVRRVYEEFQHCRNPSTFAPEDLFYAFRYGDVGFLILDLRGHRDVGRSRDPLLGADQWHKIRGWLTSQASELGALFVASSVPMIHVARALADVGGLVKSDLRDQWTYEVNRPELARMLHLLFDLSNHHDLPITVLGGDVHVGTVACIRSSHPAHVRRPRIYQLTSSPISNRPVEGSVARLLDAALARPVAVDSHIEGRVLHHFNQRNFGVVELAWDTERGGYTTVFQLHREDRPTFRFALG